ncbi:MAG: hypothetical protein DRH12_16905 [Deltaproteobacteria bacterium]|nr:MAG: hypothetical protein DRH12_16905 [Deltaproteobacteria bacterium]
MPWVKCPNCEKETWWGVWSYDGEKLCGWCGASLEVKIKDGELREVKLGGVSSDVSKNSCVSQVS